MSASASLICKILAVFLLFCMSKASGGTCLSYGHSCWGGHGKRNGATHQVNPLSQKYTSEWYISKLLNPPPENLKNMIPVFKNQNQDTEDIDRFRKYGYQLYPSTDVQKNTPRSEPEDAEPKPNKWNPEPNDSEDEVVILTPDFQSVPISKFRLLQMMNQEDSKTRS